MGVQSVPYILKPQQHSVLYLQKDTITSNNSRESVLIMLGFNMDLWGGVVLKLDNHPEYNKGPDRAPYACPKTYFIDHISSHTT